MMDVPWRRARRRSLLLLATLSVAALAAMTAGAGPGRAAEPAPPSTIADPWSHLDEGGRPIVDLWFGWSSTCPHCAKARAWLADLGPTLRWLEVHSLQVDGPDGPANVDQLVGLAAGIGEEIGGVPAFLFAGRLEVGFDEASTSGTSLEADLVAYHDALLAATGGVPSSAAPPSAGATAPAAGDPATAITLPVVGAIEASAVSLPLLAVVLGGLDAVNPCALSILLFLVSALVGAGSRRRIVLVGGAFVLATGVVYFLLMAAWLNAFLWLGELRFVTVLAGAAALVAGVINLKDFGWFRRGPSLVIPESARPAIFGRVLDVSETVAMPALIGTTVLVAATASAYEMLCTGGFPVVFTRVLTLSALPTAAYYAYLGLYVLVYVLPMLAIVGIFAITLGTRGISIDEARRLKLLSGLLMVGIGGLLLFAPDRLSDLTWTIGLFASAIAVWSVLVVLDRRRLRPSVAPSVAQARK